MKERDLSRMQALQQIVAIALVVTLLVGYFLKCVFI